VKIALIKPLAPLHLGEATGALDRVSDIIHSDTLFSAICHAWGYLYGKQEVDELLSSFVDDRDRSEPPFMISSCFPFIGSGDDKMERIYYLPSPLNIAGSFSLEKGKTVKGMRFVDKETYIKWLNGGLGDGDTDRMIESEKALRCAMGNKINVHVALDRVTSAGSPYYVSRLHFSRDSGLYFFYSCKGEHEDKFRSALRLLGDMGIGGERSAGCGAFHVEFMENGWSSPSITGTADHWLTLSLVFPTQDDLKDLGGSRIRLLERKGWISSPFTTDSFRRKRVMMLAEGSLLSSRISGSLVDVSPSIWDRGLHPVYRYGLAWLIPARGGA